MAALIIYVAPNRWQDDWLKDDTDGMEHIVHTAADSLQYQ
jgi:hypothetical protein